MGVRAALNALFEREGRVPVAKNAPQPGSIQTSAQLAAFFGLGRGGTPAEDPATQVREGFSKNVVVYRCIREIAGSAASVKPVVYRKKQDGDIEELPNHELTVLLNRPNIRQSWSEFIENVVGFLALNGNTYYQAIMVDGGRRLKELNPLRPDFVEPKIVRGVLVGYDVQTPSGVVTFPVDPVTGQCEIVHTKTWNPLDEFRGMSPLKAAALSTDIHNATSEWNKNLLDNSAQPSGALKMTVTPGMAPPVLTEPEFNLLKEELESSRAGPGGAGRPMVLQGGLDWVQMGLSPKDMDWMNSRNTTAREIALAFGVPPMLLGIPGDNTYSNQKEARLWFWEDTVLPTLSLALGGLNRFLDVQFRGQNIFVGYDEDAISALNARREDMWDRITKSEILKLDEKREALGYEAVAGDVGDLILVTGSLKPIEQVAAEPPDPVALAEAVTRAKQPPAAANSNAPAGNTAQRQQVAKFRKELLHTVSQLPELKFSDPGFRAGEIAAKTKLLDAAENALRIAVKKNLLATGQEVAKTIRHRDLVGVDDIIEEKASELEDVMTSHSYAAAEIIADRFFTQMKSAGRLETKGLLDYFWNLVSTFVVEHVAKQVTRISDTTKKDVRAAIADGLQNAEGYDAIADRVMSVMRTASATRAMTIASTEAHTVTSFAAQASAESVAVPMEREWAAAGGARTRPTHRHADGQTRSMQEPFSVGGASMMYPGDPAGPASETINCRCVLLYNPKI